MCLLAGEEKLFGEKFFLPRPAPFQKLFNFKLYGGEIVPGKFIGMT